MKKKNLIFMIAILFAGLSLAGGTYAYLTLAANVTNGNYVTQTTCFNIDYNINNVDNSQDITGTMFPSSGPTGGLNGRVGIKVNSSCNVSGVGTLTLHVNTGTSASLMSGASSYCENRRTLEAISGVTTEADCNAAGGRWVGYGDNYCEDPTTLQRMPDYTTQNDCTSHSGTWKSGGSPLKYAVYDNSSATGIPLSVGYITSSDIDNDITIYDDFQITTTQAYYYIFIWLDGNLTSNAVNDLPFSGYVKAEANQANVKIIYRYGEDDVQIGDRITLQQFQVWCANDIYSESSCADGDYWETKSECETHVTENHLEDKVCELGYIENPDYFYESGYFKYVIVNNIIAESYIGFIVRSWMEEDYPGMTEGRYYLRGFDTYDETGCKSQYYDSNTGNCVSPYYAANKTVLQSAFGTNTSYCTQYYDTNDYPSAFVCSVPGLGEVTSFVEGEVVVESGSMSCHIGRDGSTGCY